MLWPIMGRVLSTWPMAVDKATGVNVYDLDPACPEEERLERLREMWEGSEDHSLYEDAHRGLIRAYRRTHQRRGSQSKHEQLGNEEFIQSLGWLADLSDGFVERLEGHDPPALVLVCHYVRLLDNLSFSFWWTHSNSMVCAARIRRILPGEWLGWVV